MKSASQFPDIARALIKPVVAFCVRRGFRFQEMVTLLKEALLEISSDELKGKNESINISRLSVLTGLQRKEIKSFLATKEDRTSPTNLLTRVMGQWEYHPSYCSKPGVPRALTFEGVESEFADLVHSVSADINPYTVRFALEQSKLVERKGGKIVLSKRVFDPGDDAISGLALLANDMSLLVAAVEHNLFDQPKIPNLHVTTVFDNVDVGELEKIRKWLVERGAAFHDEVREYLAKRDKDANPRLYDRKGGGKVSVTTFSLTKEEGEK